MIAIENLMPDMLILDFRTDEFRVAQFFLKDFFRFRVSHPNYRPSIFLSQAAAAILHQTSETEAKPSAHKDSQQELVVIEPFELETLQELLFIAILQLS